ncbi:hypothetical protein [Clostridium sp.]|uniref:hypothetical protein n=1 Tax=Clostridium sp. TaxID=1506 RepID=UPI003F4B605F
MNKSISIFLSVICIIGLVGCDSKKNEALTSIPSSKSVEQSQNINDNQTVKNNEASDKTQKVTLTTTATKTQTVNKAILNPLNATYNIENNLIKLANGKSIMEIIPGSASKLITTGWKQPIVGDLNGDKINDAALILIQNGGGSGSFYYIAANISTKEGKYIGTNTILLGDRINPQSIKIQNGNIVVNYLDRKENDPMSTKPSVSKTRTFLVKGTSLSEKSK